MWPVKSMKYSLTNHGEQQIREELERKLILID